MLLYWRLLNIATSTVLSYRLLRTLHTPPLGREIALLLLLLKSLTRSRVGEWLREILWHSRYDWARVAALSQARLLHLHLHLLALSLHLASFNFSLYGGRGYVLFCKRPLLIPLLYIPD